MPATLEWDFDLPICDRFMAQDLLKLLGISILVLSPILFLSFYAFILVVAVILLTVLVRSIIQRSYRQVRFRVESRGAGFITRMEQRDVFKGISFLLILMGIAKPSLTTIVIGLQQSQTSGAGIGSDIGWDDVRQVLLYPKERVVLLKECWFTGGLGGGLRSVRLYCTSENYETIAAMSLEYSKKKIRRSTPSVIAYAKNEGCEDMDSCPKCGARADLGDAYCINCGGNLQAEAEDASIAKQHVPTLRESELGHQAFCVRCGAKLGGSEHICASRGARARFLEGSAEQ